jgi:hypothetical protein
MAESAKSLGTELRRELIALLDGGQAHATFDDAVKNFPANLRGVVPEGLPYSAWQIVEHLRIAQRDILDFSDNSGGAYKSLKWPQDYWPRHPEPEDAAAWAKSLAAIRADRKAFDKLLHNADDHQLVKPFAWGKDANLLREALLIADHNAYHTGELIVVRRLVGAWKK